MIIIFSHVVVSFSYFDESSDFGFGGTAQYVQPSRYKIGAHTTQVIEIHHRYYRALSVYERARSNNSYKSYRRFQYDAGVQTLLLSYILLHLCPSIFWLCFFFLSMFVIPFYLRVCVWVCIFVSAHYVTLAALENDKIKVNGGNSYFHCNKKNTSEKQMYSLQYILYNFDICECMCAVQYTNNRN